MSVEKAIEEYKNGNFLIVVDDESRENEGDLIIAAESATAEKINFMITNGKGLVCVPMLPERLDELKIPLMVPEQDNTENTKCSFTVSVDYKYGTTTGISAFDRAKTVKALIDKDSKPEDFARPGHIFPLRYKDGGVLKRPGHTEAVIDFSRLAGVYPAGVLCEIINDDGTMARLDDLKKFSKKHGIMIVSIKDLVEYLKKS